MRTQANKQSKLRQCIGAPKRFLKKARDFYVDSMMNIDGMVGYAAVPALSTPVLPTSFIVVRTQKDGGGRGGDNVKDLRKMQHSMSMKEFGCKKVELDKGVGERSYSVLGLGRIATIEEDKSYEFEEEVNVKNDLFARSRSYAIPRRNSSGYY